MLLTAKVGLAGCMFYQYTEEQVKEFVLRHLSDQIALQIMDNNYIDIKVSDQNDGKEYECTFALLTENDYKSIGRKK